MEKNQATLSSESAGDTSRLASRDSPLSEGLNVVTYLSDELIAKILSYLPVKPLLRFKCVSKPWYSLIESPHFIKMHLKRSVECKTNFGIIIRVCRYYSVHFDLLEDATAIEIDDPLKTSFYDAAVVGSCNGLFCMLNARKDILLWNPSTRKCQKLPAAPVDLPRSFSICGGFGYDSLTDDYKVVTFARPYSDGDEVLDSKVAIYSLKTNSWKHIKDLRSYLQFQELWGTFVSGALHWVTIKTVESLRYLSIIAFELGDESYWELSLPKVEAQSFNMTVGVLGGCLSILAKEPHDRMNVWVMNEYGKVNSWSKLFSVKQLEVIGSFDTLRPLIYSKSGKDVLLEVDKKKIVWFDLERNEVKNVNVRGIPNIFHAEVYAQSLVQLEEEEEEKEEEEEEGEEGGGEEAAVTVMLACGCCISVRYQTDMV